MSGNSSESSEARGVRFVRTPMRSDSSKRGTALQSTRGDLSMPTGWRTGFCVARGRSHTDDLRRTTSGGSRKTQRGGSNDDNSGEVREADLR